MEDNKDHQIIEICLLMTMNTMKILIHLNQNQILSLTLIRTLLIFNKQSNYMKNKRTRRKVYYLILFKEFKPNLIQHNTNPIEIISNS
jgi:hypothetical protein